KFNTGKMPVPQKFNTGKMPVPQKFNTGKMPVPQKFNFLVGSRGWAGDPAHEILIDNGDFRRVRTYTLNLCQQEAFRPVPQQRVISCPVDSLRFASPEIR
ncbi:MULTISPECIES: hypothetical protein, partial [unclassified Microcoleus]|uniref:hypothetical protein n=1 Tax=unclassified Microcoleus TaxID=2642155 RepID=UPI002FD0B170